MFTKVSKYMTKAISYPAHFCNALAMAAMLFVTLAVTLDVVMRYFFQNPLIGVWDLNTLAFAVIVWGPMGLAAIRGSHIALGFLLDKFPRLPQLVLRLIISFVAGGTMGVVSWRLFLYAMTLQSTKFFTPSMRIQYWPFAYFVAVSCAVMALGFLAGFPEIVAKIRKEQ